MNIIWCKPAVRMSKRVIEDHLQLAAGDKLDMKSVKIDTPVSVIIMLRYSFRIRGGQVYN